MIYAPAPPTVVGTLKTLVVDGREVRVWTPAGLDRRRPVPSVWFADGRNVLDATTSFSRVEWGADEAMTDGISRGTVRPAVIVTVDNGGLARADEYLPTRAKFGSNEGGGKADAHLRFWLDRVWPAVDREVRLSRRPEDTTIVGASFGGIFALHAGLTRPDRFGTAAVVSPSIWWDDRAMLRRIEGFKKVPGVRFWIDAGTEEGPDTVANARAVHLALLERGGHSTFTIGPGDRHDERAWSRRLPAILEWITNAVN